MLRVRLQRGFTLVELLVSITLMALLMLLAAPSVGAWIQNGQIRTAADTVVNGLQIARSEAVRRNTLARFQLMTTAADGCALSNAGPSWVVSLDVATSNCGSAPSDTVAPRIVQRRDGNEGTSNAVIASDASSITFNSLGRMTAPAAAVTINVSFANGTCAAAGGELRCLRIAVTPAGQVRMCDPAVTSTGDNRRC